MIPGIELELGGQVYIVPPLSLPALRLLTPKLKSMRGISDATQQIVFDAAYLALKRNYPDITRRQIEGFVQMDDAGEITANEEGLLPDIATMERALEAILDVSGLKRREIDEGKARAAESSTGTSSTCLLYTSPSPRDRQKSRMPSSA